MSIGSYRTIPAEIIMLPPPTLLVPKTTMALLAVRDPTFPPSIRPVESCSCLISEYKLSSCQSSCTFYPILTAIPYAVARGVRGVKMDTECYETLIKIVAI